jgi:hypothetical protein
MPRSKPSEPRRYLMSPRTALVLLLALLVGAGAAGLSIARRDGWPAAILAGAGAAGAALVLFDRTIGPADGRDGTQ